MLKEGSAHYHEIIIPKSSPARKTFSASQISRNRIISVFTSTTPFCLPQKSVSNKNNHQPLKCVTRRNISRSGILNWMNGPPTNQVCSTTKCLACWCSTRPDYPLLAINEIFIIDERAAGGGKVCGFTTETFLKLFIFIEFTTFTKPRGI